MLGAVLAFRRCRLVTTRTLRAICCPRLDLSADIRNLVLLAVVWVLAILLVDPRGDFPFVDDWAYAQSVRHLLDGHEIKFSNWTATNLISQVFWGALFAETFGTSFTVLRGSTLVAAWLGVAAFYQFSRFLGLEPHTSLLASLCLLFNPLYCALSFTFMTDVPFTAAQTGAMWMLSEGLVRGATSYLSLGWIVAVVALLCRQIGMAIPLGFGCAYMYKRGFRIASFVAGVVPLLMFIALQLGYEAWLRTYDKLPMNFGRQINSVFDRVSEPPIAIMIPARNLLVFAFFYLGLFLFPLSLLSTEALVGRWSATVKRWAVFVLLGSSVLVAALGLWWRGPMPMWFDTLTPGGVGADIDGPKAPYPVLFTLTFISAIGGVLLICAIALILWRNGPHRANISETPKILSGSMFLFLLIPILFIDPHWQFDRYLLPLIPCLGIFIMAGSRERRGDAERPLWCSVVTWSFVTVTAVFAIASTHDYIAGKRAQWAALQELLRSGVISKRIDAGFAYNGLYLYGRDGDTSPTIPNYVTKWYEQRDFVISAHSEFGYEVISTYPVARWLPWGRSSVPILVQRRQ